VLILRHKAQSVNPECAKVSYTLDGEKKDIRLFTSYALLLSDRQLKDIRFSGRSDEIEATVRYTVPGFPAGENDLLRVSQKYNGTNGEISFGIKAEAPDGYYHIVHVLPAGLEFTGLDWEAYKQNRNVWVSEVKGQQVTFVVYKDKKALSGTVKFDTRAVMTGSFHSEGTYIVCAGKPEFANRAAGGVIAVK